MTSEVYSHRFDTDIIILDEHHGTLGDELRTIVCDNYYEPGISVETVIGLLHRNYRNEGPTHESEFENSRPITLPA